MKEYKKDIIIKIDETQTIVELSQLLQPYEAEVYLVNYSEGRVVEANVKSLLGLISMRVGNGDKIKLRAVGADAEEAANEVINFLT